MNGNEHGKVCGLLDRIWVGGWLHRNERNPSGRDGGIRRKMIKAEMKTHPLPICEVRILVVRVKNGLVHCNGCR